MDALLARLEPTFRFLDRVAGGRHAGVTAAPEAVAHPRTRRAFARVAWLLAVELLLGLGAVAIAVGLALGGASVSMPVWMRTVVVLGITATLFYFTWRASLGWYWAYQRLLLFTRIFPIVTLVLAAIPHLYPAWMISEQIVFSLILIGIGAYLGSAQLREVFPRPGKPGHEG
ncbi:hypothetical protein [Gryllotalpicola protaetiae]|uniref:Uncharacterized protein n=1 Tax=Gryllotalpicola protaetiae TaxID=2419771 RepID=A0A387BRL6_9MICO|nr:hypothetical protein [Gryllotalpicola protaetiae]AYG04734.1 hypothetical protein D7I44_15165 [Gryllotalpicola protaetiae]